MKKIDIFLAILAVFVIGFSSINYLNPNTFIISLLLGIALLVLSLKELFSTKTFNVIKIFLSILTIGVLIFKLFYS